MKNRSIFDQIARLCAWFAGRPAGFTLAVVVVVAWIMTGPIFHYSDTWQLVINTGTTIVTFLMVFLIQCTQNRDTEAMHIKLDELIRAVDGAHNALLDLENLTEEELDRIRSNYMKLAERSRQELAKGGSDLGTSNVNF